MVVRGYLGDEEGGGVSAPTRSLKWRQELRG